MIQPGASRSGGGRAQSNTIGFILVLGIVIAGTTAVVALGSSTLTDVRGQAELQRAEHSMTLFDSRAAMVALGASESQSVRFGQDGGSYRVNGSSGYIAITHVNYHADDGDRETETIYNQSFGSVRYENGDTEIAYQGGGVWRVDRGGEATMVSPPEFHYREATLTLPIIQIRGDDSGSGAVDLSMRRASQTSEVFPDTTHSTPPPGGNIGAPYDDTSFRSGSDLSYLNPVQSGDVYAWVHSEYYQAWANYFRQRTSGNVTVFDHNQTVRLELVTLGGEPGNFPVPNNYDDTGDELDVNALGPGHPIEEFSTTFVAAGNLQNAHFSYWADTGDDIFEINVEVFSKCQGGSWKDWNGGDDFTISVYYENTTTGEHHEWEGSDEEANDTSSASNTFDIDCSGSDPELTVNFTNSDLDLEYTQVGQNSGQYQFTPGSADSSATIDEHAQDPGTTFQTSGSGTMTLNNTVNHYFSFMGDRWHLRTGAGPGNSNRIDEGASTGELRYVEAAGAQYITYLHVTENELEVNVD